MPRCLVLAALLLSATHARAEPDRTIPAQSFTFEDELVSGDLVSPSSELLSVRRRTRRASLIEVRTSYVDKLLQSIEDL
ncbi:MAG: hypothetical protein ABW352_25810 [Polyangiales bacterium]